MKEKLKITRKQMMKFYKFCEEHGIEIDAKKVFKTSIYFDIEESYAHLEWSKTSSDKVLRRMLKMINAIILSDHVLVFKD